MASNHSNIFKNGEVKTKITFVNIFSKLLWCSNWKTSHKKRSRDSMKYLPFKPSDVNLNEFMNPAQHNSESMFSFKSRVLNAGSSYSYK